MGKNKYYVVWNGICPGIYTSWTDCQRQINGYEGAIYKSFNTQEEAEKAYNSSPYIYIGKKKEETNLETKQSNDTSQYPQVVQKEAIAVDAACSGNPGPMEYRGVYLRTGQQIFHFGPIHGTNNIGEFLAIVPALALLKKQGLSMPIYSDSRNAIGWIKQKKCKTKLERNARTEEVFQMIDRAESWLKNNSYNTQVLKWNTSEWGEVPADFDRK